LRDLDRPLFGKTGTTSGPTNVWFVGGSPDIVAGVYMGYDQPRSMGGYAQGGRIAAPIFKKWAQTALKDQPKTPFVAPAGIRWVRIDRGSGKRVYGVFPVTEDPKSSVIWEAFQPQTEPRRTYRSTLGDPYNTQQQQAQWQAMLRQRQAALQQRAAAQGRPAPARTAPTAQPPLPTQNSL
jgi:penicillin-binding protein 1A